MVNAKERWLKDAKVGEGTYAVVYKGPSRSKVVVRARNDGSSGYTGREASTNRPIAIKKIKIGQFKDGLDMSAVREVKYLRELHHPNVIEVRESLRDARQLTSGFAAR